MTVRTLLKSPATPPASRPTASIFWACVSLLLQLAALADVAEDQDAAAHPAGIVAHRSGIVLHGYLGAAARNQQRVVRHGGGGAAAQGSGQWIR